MTIVSGFFYSIGLNFGRLVVLPRRHKRLGAPPIDDLVVASGQPDQR